MLSLESHHIVDLFCWVDDRLEKKTVSRGRPSKLTDSDLITLLLWNTMMLHQKTLKDLYVYANLHLQPEFGSFPSYGNFVAHCHRALPLLWDLLQSVLADDQIRIADSTMLEVCKLHRANRHKTARGIAKFGYNHQGAHFGFKLHASVSLDGRLCNFSFTPASEYDGHLLSELVDHRTRLIIGDQHYGARVTGEEVRKRAPDLVILTSPLVKQRKKITTKWQRRLLRYRSKIEAVFDVLKEHLHLVSSFPRSINGYLLHYVRILLGYQILALSGQR